MAVESRSLSNPLTCWSCQTVLDGAYLFCPHCHIVQAPLSLNVFERYGMLSDFDIDQKLLEETYNKVQMILHPDKFVGRTSREVLYSSQQTMEMNNAYEVLCDDVARAEALLEIKGIVSEGETVNDPEILMMSMEDRETLAETNKIDQINALAQSAKKRMKSAAQALSDLFKNDDFNAASQKTLELKYLRKFLNDIKEKKRKLRDAFANS